MKELEKTKRISIAAVITILVVLIGVLSFKRPKNMYSINTKTTLEEITSNNNFISLDSINKENIVLVDIRNQYEYDKGHLDKALNISTTDILNEDAMDVIKQLKNENKTIVLYGDNPNEAITAFMLLYQLGFDNIKILAVKNSYDHNKLITKNIEVEKPVADIKAFIDESLKKAKIKPEPKKVVVPQKKVITVKKKKKLPVEGGC